MVMTEQSDDNLVACWSCRGPVATAALFCHTCGAVQPPGGQNHFARSDCRGASMSMPAISTSAISPSSAISIPIASPARRRGNAPLAESQSASLNQA
jgi:molecular chaperone HscB